MTLPPFALIPTVLSVSFVVIITGVVNHITLFLFGTSWELANGDKVSRPY
jgi:hypothetical protein